MGDAFDILALPARFDLALEQIRRAYLAAIAALHPDRAGESPKPASHDVEVDADEFEARSASLNEAKRTLEDPERRANALLARLGGPDKERDRSLPDGFLMEIMEVRESMEAASTAGELAQWKTWALERRREYEHEASRAFTPLVRGVPSLSDDDRTRLLMDVRRSLNAWRYIERLIEQLDQRAQAD
jgi:molecular chaperone HscB